MCEPWISTPDRIHQLSEPDDVEHPSEIVGERSQAELSANFLETTHQERALVHPLFDCAKRTLHLVAEHAPVGPTEEHLVEELAERSFPKCYLLAHGQP